ncbi:hypothetical protein OH807_00230 [Kitasatospora sp. NBC_01560]|uniref:hypothetical protein n=1 Tax=Kitasatospora sp. NBC_01560 TaxID=2975965 RepID=UPI003867CFF5
MLAVAVAANAYRDDDRYLLTADTYRTAALVVETLAESVPENGGAGQVVLYTVPAWKLEALWDVLLVLRRTVAGDPGTDVVRELLELLCAGMVTPARRVERIAADLEKVVAVLMLQLPAVAVVATAAVLGEERGEAVLDAYRRITAAWTEAGVRH